jgi:hypothetical protein
LPAATWALNTVYGTAIGSSAGGTMKRVTKKLISSAPRNQSQM